MKKLFKSLLSFVAVAASFVACNPDQPLPVPAGTVITVDLTQVKDQLASLPAKNVPSISFDVTADGEWLATTPAWITIDPSHANGSTSVTITVADNVDAEGNLQGPRSGKITLSLVDADVSVEVIVEQLGDDSLDTRRTYVKVTEVTSGKAYLLVVKKSDDTYNIPILFGPTGSYGYPKPKTVTLEEDGSIKMEDASYGLIFTDAGRDAAYTIQQSDGRYIWHQGGFNTWSCGEDPTEGNLWKIDAVMEDGTVRITDLDNGGILQYGNGGYDSFAAYSSLDEANSILPWLYEDTKAAEIDDSKCFFATSSVKAAADSVQATFEVKANIPWTLEKTAGDWITDFTPKSGEADATITVTFTANETEEARTATFHLASTDGRFTSDLTLTQASPAVTTLADVIAAGEGEFTAKNLLVLAIGGSNVIVRDNTATMLAYGRDLAAAVKVGDIISLSGAVKAYNGVIEWNIPTADVASSDNAVDHGKAVVLDEAALAAYAEAPVVEYAEAEGVHTGTDYPTLKIGEQLLNLYGAPAGTEGGKTYKVTGYTIGYDSKNTKTNFVVVTCEEVEVEEPFEWDYTPGEDYLNPNNVWKPVFDGDQEFIFGTITGNEVLALSDMANVVKEKSTYVFTFPEAATGTWGNVNFISPDEANGHTISLKAGRTYTMKATVCATADVQKFVFSLHQSKLPEAFTAEEIEKGYNPTSREHDWLTDMWSGLTAYETKEYSTSFECTADVNNISWTIMPQEGTPAGMVLYIKDITIIPEGEPEPEYAKFQWREDSVAEQTAAFNTPGAAHWYIDADKDVEWTAVVKLNGTETTEAVTVEHFDAGGGHIAINYAQNTDPGEKVWDITVTTESYVENRTLTAKLTQGAYEYSDLAELNAAIIASGTKEVTRIIDLSKPVEITKVEGSNVFLQGKGDNFTGGLLLYGTGLESKLEAGKSIQGKVTAVTKAYNGVPEVTKVTYNDGDVTFTNTYGWPNQTITIAQLKENYIKYANVKCTIMNAQVTKGFSSTTRSGEIKDATGEIATYVQLKTGINGAETGSNLTQITVWPTFYNKNQQVGVWSDASIKIKSITSTITIPATKSVAKDSTVSLGATTNSTATITYASSDEAVATVSAEGVVTGVAAGEATITASVEADGLYTAATATCVVTVTAEASADVEYALYSGEIVEGDYIIYYDGKAMNTTVTSNRLQYAEITPEGNSILNPDEAIVWHIAASGDSWTLYNAAAGKFAVSTGTKNQAGVADEAGDKGLWTITETAADAKTYEIVNDYNKGSSVNSNLRNNGTYGFATYSTGTGGPLSLYKKK